MTVQPLPKGDGADSKARLRLWLHLLRTTRGVENRVRDHLRVYAQTTLPRFDVMAALYREPNGLTMSQLSQRLMVSNGNVTGIIEYLVKQELVEREKLAHDKRSNMVRLTAKGWDVFTDLAAQHESWIEDVFTGLDEEDIAGMNALLDKIHSRRKESAK